MPPIHARGMGVNPTLDLQRPNTVIARHGVPGPGTLLHLLTKNQSLTKNLWKTDHGMALRLLASRQRLAVRSLLVPTYKRFSQYPRHLVPLDRPLPRSQNLP